ncbi:MAG: SDR family oxidoreductase [Gammaproteobacteria bacterium]|nr:SDR family oxidoreductase [Gammaproteobacteria bacterium]
MNIVITGSTRGLGFATAKRLLSEGHSVTISSESGADVTEALEQLETMGLQARGTRCDISSEDDVRRLLRLVRDGGLEIDGWINNAGVPGVTGRTDQLPTAALMKLVDINIKGTCLCSMHALRLFQAQGHGRLLNVVGRGEKSPVPFANAYGPSKMWIRNFTMAAAKEVKGSNIAVATFQPGLVHTKMTLEIRVVRGHERRVKYLGALQRFLGNEPEIPGDAMAAVITGDMKNGKAYRAPVFGPFFSRLISPPPKIAIAVDAVEAETDI